MKLNTVLKIVCLSLTAFILFWIFVMSAQNADESSKTSKNVGQIVAPVINRDFNKMTEEQKEEYVLEIDHEVRKTAHVTEFFALGALLFLDFYLFKIRKPFCALFAFLSGVVFASLDEIHQIFIPGRAGMVTDVLIDAAGIAGGVAAALLLVLIIERIKRRKKAS